MRSLPGQNLLGGLFELLSGADRQVGKSMHDKGR